MTDHGTVRPSIAREFHAAVVSLLPDFDDYQMEYIIGAKGVLRKALREALAGKVPELRDLRTIAHDGKRSVEDLVEIGRFNVGPMEKGLLKSENFPMEPHEPKTRTIVLIRIDHDNITPKQVLYEFEQRGLKCPTYEDALYFGIDYANEIEEEIVFLHEPLEKNDPHRQGKTIKRVISLSKSGPCDRYRTLNLHLMVWRRGTFFAAVVE